MKQYENLSSETISKALSFVGNEGRDVWVRMAMAVKTELGEDGFEIWDNWSRTGSSYNEKAAKQVWKSAKIGRGVSIGTLIFEALAAGFRFDNDNQQTITDEQAADRQRERDARIKQAEAEERQRQKEAEQHANEVWNAAEPIEGNEHPYLKEKQVKAYGLRRGRWALRNKDGQIYAHAENVLLIPIVNSAAKITSLQGVFDQVPAGYLTNKAYLKDGKKSGGFHIIGKMAAGGTVCICEGYATGATIHAATGWCVVVAFDSGNLNGVLASLREAAPQGNYVIAADNDQWTKAGKIENPGVHFAKLAASGTGARVVVPQFSNLDGKPTDFNDLGCREGLDAVRLQLVGEPVAANDNDEDPFKILGYNRDSFFVFQNEKKQMKEMSSANLTETGLLQIAPLWWWSMEFPAKGSPFDKRAAVDWFIRQAYKAGIYDPSRVRGRGAWTDDGRVVFHFGSHLSVDGVSMPVTAIKSRYVYEADRMLAVPVDVALTDDEGRNLVEISKHFRWTKPASAALLSGFVALAPLCGALRWRPHIWITGGAGCGKTTVLNDYVHRLMGGMALFAQGNSSEAGIRQQLRSDAMPVLMDESEQNNEREVSRVQNVLSLIRQASSESAAMTLKGTAGGEAMQFLIRSMFCLSSIQVGMKHQADFERLTVLALRPKREDTDAAQTWDVLKDRLRAIERDETLPARLFHRSLSLLPVTLRNIQTFIDAASRKFGSVREGDQYGTLMAGCWSLLSSELATPEQAAELINRYEWEEYRENLETDESAKAFGVLLESQIRLPAGTTATLYELIRIADDDHHEGRATTKEDAAAILARFGVRLTKDEVLLSNNSNALDSLMKNTPYAADWRGQVRRVQGVRRYEKTVRFNGQPSKCLAVRLEVLREARLISDEAPL